MSKLEKPILFNTEMTKSILEGRKTSTRRIIKPQPNHSVDNIAMYDGIICFNEKVLSRFDVCQSTVVKKPYQVGNGLWVRETWSFQPCSSCEGKCDVKAPDYFKEDGCYVYRTNYGSTEDDTFPPSMFKWHPSIHMPRKAARIFLKVTGVWVQKLQDIGLEGMKAEGCLPNYVCGGERVALQQEYFKPLWDGIYKNWNENPYVWVIEFEKVGE